jgi:prophage regulatory protein
MLWFSLCACRVQTRIRQAHRTAPHKPNCQTFLFVRRYRRAVARQDSKFSPRYQSISIASQDNDMARQETAPIKRTIRRHQLREIVPLADSTIYEMEQHGEFPRRFALSARYIVWDLAEVEAWLEARRSKALARAPHPDVRQRRTRPVKGPDRAAAAASKAE